MTRKKKNLLCDSLSDITVGNTANMFEFVMELIEQSSEEILHSNSHEFFIGLVLSGEQIGTKANEWTFWSAAKDYDLGDSNPRTGVRFRDISNHYYKDNMPNITDGIPNPLLEPNDVKRDYLIKKHPIAYMEDNKKIPIYGGIVAIREIDGSFYIDDAINISQTTQVEEETTTTTGASSAGDSDFSTSSTGPPPETLSRNLIPEIATLISSGTARLLLFGDSQTNGWIGRHIMNYFRGKGAGGKKRMKTVYEKQGKHSQQPVYYYSGAGWSAIKPLLEQGAELVIMTLGGNGIIKAKKMIEKVKKANKSSDAVYIWLGPPPPAKDGKTYKYNEPVYSSLENRNDVPRHRQRKGFADFLQNEIASEVTHYINPHIISGFEDSYSCGGECDGVHTPNKIAKTLLINAGIIEGEST